MRLSYEEFLKFIDEKDSEELRETYKELVRDEEDNENE